MSKNSLDYVEQMGLSITLSNLKTIDITYQDEEWCIVAEWIENRIKQLTNK